MESKRTIHVDRPDGTIPGLGEVNRQLRAMGVEAAVGFDIDTRDPERFTLDRVVLVLDSEVQ